MWKQITLPNATNGVSIKLDTGTATRDGIPDWTVERVCWREYETVEIIRSAEGEAVMILRDAAAGRSPDTTIPVSGKTVNLSNWQKWVRVEFRSAATFTIRLRRKADVAEEAKSGFRV